MLAAFTDKQQSLNKSAYMSPEGRCYTQVLLFVGFDYTNPNEYLTGFFMKQSNVSTTTTLLDHKNEAVVDSWLLIRGAVMK
jgi:hypothetical protein